MRISVVVLMFISLLGITACNKQNEAVEPQPVKATYTGYITKKTPDRILVASDTKMTGSEMYGAIWLGSSDDSLVIGQHVEATLKGDIDSSYPGVGSASSVVVLPILISGEAKLKPEQALAVVISSRSDMLVPIITKVTYEETTKKWVIGILDGLAPKPSEEIVTINDEDGK
ncbi:DUF3221 domain-containing protein [Paenibacillus lignilyticus]|uniref:DUF3221 domain-containing protein n=1 Tax=Paenibacillus lignilyticus TaxID=1172615 RepID=A0ABS5CKZ0_9BACL|nr:DUF3221 domain-containing protein [Paenibacillus lignilyticus]MBP3966528.1 DUF3221 domain-containing protein [Paenibacillus lignilyticus]